MSLFSQLWSSWAQTADTAVRTVVVYVLVLVLVRVAGRRTLAQVSGYDVVVTVAIGSTLATAALPSSATVSDGVTVIATLCGLQILLGALRQRFESLQRIIDFRPIEVVRRGLVELRRSPTSSQLTPEDVASMLRRNGVTDLSQVQLAVLEPTGKLSVLQRSAPDQSGLFDRV